jgi:hypothetical protein
MAFLLGTVLAFFVVTRLVRFVVLARNPRSMTPGKAMAINGAVLALGLLMAIVAATLETMPDPAMLGAIAFAAVIVAAFDLATGLARAS